MFVIHINQNNDWGLPEGHYNIAKKGESKKSFYQRINFNSININTSLTGKNLNNLQISLRLCVL